MAINDPTASSEVRRHSTLTLVLLLVGTSMLSGFLAWLTTDLLMRKFQAEVRIELGNLWAMANGNKGENDEQDQALNRLGMRISDVVRLTDVSRRLGIVEGTLGIRAPTDPPAAPIP